jgi:hypothetical protein
MTMTRNVGGIDRVIRIVGGALMLCAVSLAFVGPQSNWAWLGLIGIAIMASGIAGVCPPYTWLGINTCKNDSQQTNPTGT